MSWSTSELRVRLAHREAGLSPQVKYFYWPFQGGISFVDLLCYLCLVFVMLSRLFIDACGHLKKKGWPLGFCLWFLLWFCYFPIWYLWTGVVLDCIDSLSLLSFLLLTKGLPLISAHTFACNLQITVVGTYIFKSWTTLYSFIIGISESWLFICNLHFIDKYMGFCIADNDLLLKSIDGF